MKEQEICAANVDLWEDLRSDPPTFDFMISAFLSTPNVVEINQCVCIVEAAGECLELAGCLEDPDLCQLPRKSFEVGINLDHHRPLSSSLMASVDMFLNFIE